MKSILTITIASSALLLSSHAFAGKPLTENQKFSQCKTLAKNQFDDVKKVKLVKLKTTRGTFQAKLKVISASDKGMFLCTIEPSQSPSIVRVDSGAGSSVAAKR